jgi:hypothetical protein
MNDATPTNGGELHMTKECPEYTGQAGSFCTITSSNIDSIPVGAKVVYASAAGEKVIDSDLSVMFGDEELVSGHVVYDLVAETGTVTFTRGTGVLTGFHADILVTSVGDVAHWDGTYSLNPAPATTS